MMFTMSILNPLILDSQCSQVLSILWFQIEAKSVEHIKNVNKGLENKIIQLQQKLDSKVGGDPKI